MFNDIQTLEKDLSGSLDNSIRVKLRKRGISFSQNIYCGFDTEYKNIDPLHNKLLSAQLAVNTQTILKIPLSEEYNFGIVNSQTGEITPDESVYAKGFSTVSVLKMIRSSLKIYRDIKYPKYDESLNQLITGLIRDGVNYITASETKIFIFPNTPSKEYFKRTLDGVYSLQELVSTAKTLVHDDLSLEFKTVVEKLKRIYEKGFDRTPVDRTSVFVVDNDSDNVVVDDSVVVDSTVDIDDVVENISLKNLPSVTDLPRIKIESLTNDDPNLVQDVDVDYENETGTIRKPGTKKLKNPEKRRT